jgi:NADH:ubiquinone oxidoreductase subunit 4 (chain M)
VVVLWMGIYPEPVLGVMHASVENIVDRLEVARAAVEGATLVAR